MAMSEFVKWENVKARRRAADTRSEAERGAAKEAAEARLDAYVRGHQLAEMRKAAQLTQGEVARRLDVSQARVSKIESGEISGIDTVRAYVSAVGGQIEVRATLGDRSWKVA
jgi:DNA-binding transcriptional regulator YiaG